MCGLLHSALLLYRNLVKDLETYGFQINPYDQCVANKMINYKQMTVVLHIDYLKLSHVDSFEFTKFAKIFVKNIWRTHIAQGEIHYYLVVGLYYSKQVTVKFIHDKIPI